MNTTFQHPTPPPKCPFFIRLLHNSRNLSVSPCLTSSPFLPHISLPWLASLCRPVLRFYYFGILLFISHAAFCCAYKRSFRIYLSPFGRLNSPGWIHKYFNEMKQMQLTTQAVKRTAISFSKILHLIVNLFSQ